MKHALKVASILLRYNEVRFSEIFCTFTSLLFWRTRYIQVVIVVNFRVTHRIALRL